MAILLLQCPSSFVSCVRSSKKKMPRWE